MFPYSRCCYAFLAISLRQDLSAVLDGLEAPEPFLGGVVRRLVVDNLTPAEWVPLSVPPILSEGVFHRSQGLHVVNTRFSPRHLKSGHYLLRGVVRCRVCDLGSSCHLFRFALSWSIPGSASHVGVVG